MTFIWVVNFSPNIVSLKQPFRAQAKMKKKSNKKFILSFVL